MSLEELLKLFIEENRKFSEESRIGFKKLRRSQRRAEKELRESQKRTEEENRIGFKELRESQKKTEKELRKSIRETHNHFNTQWGRLVEALVNNQIKPLFQARGFPVADTAQRKRGEVNGHNYEFDIIAESGDSIIVVEVKTTLRVDDVKKFLNDLSQFKTWLPRYSDAKIYGAVAFLHEASEASVFAEKCGLFTILATGSGAQIINPPEFQPREFP